MADVKISDLTAAVSATGDMQIEVNDDGASKRVTVDQIEDHVVTGLASTLDAKAPLASPALTGNPTAPTQTAGNNSTRIATTAFVKAAIDALINVAPSTLDTLDELAAALGDDANFAATMTTALAGKLAKASNLGDLTDAAAALTNLGVSAFAKTLLDDTSALAFLATLGIERGTYTPTMAFATPGTSTWAYGSQSGLWFKLPGLYLVNVAMAATPTIGTGSGDLRVSLPATVSVGGVFSPPRTNVQWTWPSGRTAAFVEGINGAAYANVVGIGSGNTFGIFGASNMADGNSHNLSFSGFFQTP